MAHTLNLSERSLRRKLAGAGDFDAALGAELDMLREALRCDGAALWLGSLAATLATGVHLAATLARIAIEEDFLRKQLPEYGAYARRVRARLIPFVL